jgi:hypothetical protein
VYAYAWWCNLILTTLLVFLSILIFSRSSRRFFFERPVLTHRMDAEDISRLAEERTADPWGPSASESKATAWSQHVQDALLSVTGSSQGDKEATEIAQDAQEGVEEHLQADMKKREDAGDIEKGDAEMSRKDKAIKLYAQPAMRVISGLADKWERVAK